MTAKLRVVLTKEKVVYTKTLILVIYHSTTLGL